MTAPAELDYQQRFTHKVMQNAAAWQADVQKAADPAALDRHLNHLIRAAELALAAPEAQDAGLGLVQASWRHAELRGHWLAWRQWIELGVTVCLQAGLALPRARLLDQLGECERLLGNPVAALTCFDEAVAVAAPDAAQQARALAHASQAHIELQQYAAAEACCRQALQLGAATGDPNDLGLIHNNWGIVHQERGKLEQALAQYDQAEAYFGQAGNRRGLANIMHNRGNVFNTQGHPVAAEESYRAALTIYRELGDLSYQATTLANLSVVLFHQHHLAEALALNIECETLARRTRQPVLRARLLNNRGLLRAAQGAYREACEWLQEAADLHRECGNAVQEVGSLCNWVEVLLDHGDKKEAALLLEQAKALSTQLGFVPPYLVEFADGLAARLARE